MNHITRITTAITRALAAQTVGWDSQDFQDLGAAVSQTVRLEDHARLGLEVLRAIIEYQGSVTRAERAIAVAQLGAAKEGPQE